MRKRLLITWLLASVPVVAAVNNATATAIWRVWSTGALTNGGGFDPTNRGSTGVDYSQQAGPQYTVSAGIATSGAASTTLTQTGGTWDNTVLGNVIQISSGTNCVAGVYVVTGFIDSNNITTNISVSPAGAASACTGVIGGAFPTLAKAASAVSPGNTVYIKATGTYTITAGLNLATSGSSGAPISWIGYSSTDSDGGSATLQTSGSSINMIGGSGNFQRFMNLTLDCNSQGISRASSFGGSNTIWDHVLVKNCLTRGLLITGASNTFKRCTFTANAGASLDLNSTGNQIRNNYFYANSATAISDTSTTATGTNVITNNVVANNTGASADALAKTGASCASITGNLFYANGRDGIRLSGSGSLDCTAIRNNIVWGNAGTGINSTVTNWSAHDYWVDINYNAIGGNGTDRANVPTGANDKALTADPTTYGAAGDFSLNSTSGGGAACKAAGSPGVAPYGTGYLDIGPLQSQAVGGGGTRTCAQ